MTWREQAAPIIAEIIERVGKSDMKELRKALRAAYPWGERKYHPYRIWCSEIKRQLSPVPPKPRRTIPKKECDPNQKELF